MSQMRIVKQDKEKMLNSLLSEVQDRHLQPEDRYEIASILESIGWNDERAAKAFGVEDIFELAAILWERSKTNIVFTPYSKPEKMSAKELFINLVQNFFRGTIFAFPMAVSVFSMVTLRFSLWSYESFSVDIATSIALGTILSFITVGGFTQAIARRGFFYIIQGYYNMSRKVTFYFIRAGFLVCVFISILIFFVNMAINLFPLRMLVIMLVYYFFLNAIWLSVTVMYILRKELLFTGLIIVGIVMVYLLFMVFGINIILSQIIALSLVSVVSVLLVIYIFKRAEKKAEKGIEPKLPKMSVTLYSVMPYFFYGTLYFTFLFVDRMIAWSADSSFMPYIIWFRGDYELGLDFSLLVLIIPMGIIEVVLGKMMLDIQTSQKSYWGDETSSMNHAYTKNYLLKLLMIFVISVACAAVLYASLKIIMNVFNPELGDVLFLNSVTHFVFIISLISYTFVASGLMNAVILFSLSQPEKVIQSIWPSLVANIIIGFVLSRWFGFEFAVIGLLAGAMLFTYLSTKKVVQTLKHLDYYMYAAS